MQQKRLFTMLKALGEKASEARKYFEEKERDRIVSILLDEAAEARKRSEVGYEKRLFELVEKIRKP